MLRLWTAYQSRFIQDEEGASMVEYELLVTLIAVVVIAAALFLGRGDQQQVQRSRRDGRLNVADNAQAQLERGCPGGRPPFLVSTLRTETQTAISAKTGSAYRHICATWLARSTLR